jgi:hypothetical protein
VEAGFVADQNGDLTRKGLAALISGLGRAENDKQVHNALAELRHAARLTVGGEVAPTQPVHVGLSAERAAQLGFDISPIHEADALYRGADGNVHVNEVKGSANALVEKLREQSDQLDRLAAWQGGGTGRMAEVVIDTDHGWTDIFGETIIDPVTRRPVRGSPHGLDRVIASKLPLRIGSRRFTTDQLRTLRQAILDDMIASGVGSSAEVRAGTATMAYAQYFGAIPTLEDLAARLGSAVP